MTEPGLVAELAEAPIAGNLRLDEHFLHAVNDKNVEGVMACFLGHPDLVTVLDGNVLCGPEALRRWLEAVFAKMRAVHLEINDISRWCIGETVFAFGTATCHLDAPDGTQCKRTKCWTDARREVAGRWVYIFHHASEITAQDSA